MAATNTDIDDNNNNHHYFDCHHHNHRADINHNHHHHFPQKSTSLVGPNYAADACVGHFSAGHHNHNHSHHHHQQHLPSSLPDRQQPANLSDKQPSQMIDRFFEHIQEPAAFGQVNRKEPHDDYLQTIHYRPLEGSRSPAASQRSSTDGSSQQPESTYLQPELCQHPAVAGQVQLPHPSHPSQPNQHPGQYFEGELTPLVKIRQLPLVEAHLIRLSRCN